MITTGSSQVTTRNRSTLRAWSGRRSGWAIGDDIVSLREVGTDNRFDLPQKWNGDPWVLGAGRACQIRIDHDTVSKKHALLKREDDRWVLSDFGSKNGLVIDGVPQARVQLAAGMVLRIGEVRLVAESLSFLELRSFLARVIGWDDAATAAVDDALQEIRVAQLRRDPLVLVGNGDLAPIARDLHDHMMGRAAPFVTADPARIAAQEETVRTTQNQPKLRDAIQAAAGGAVFVRTNRLPRDFGVVAAHLRDPREPRVQLYVAGEKPPDMDLVRYAGPIVFPNLDSRREELQHVIAEYVADTQHEFRLGIELSARDRQWIVDTSASIADIAKATRRVIALRAEPTLSGAARRLGMATVSLRRWLAKRPALGDVADTPTARGGMRGWLQGRRSS